MLPAQYFKRSEFACKCKCGFDTVDAETLDILVFLRKHYGIPITINSGCRCLNYNRTIGSNDTSMHTKGRAVDITIQGISPKDVYEFLDRWYPDELGLGLYKTFVHLDTRTGKKARWKG